MDDYEYADEPLFQSTFSDRERAGRSVGLGAITAGDQFQRAQRRIHRSELSEPERFVEDVERFCVENRIGFSEETRAVYETIAKRYPRPSFLNPGACVLAVTRALDAQNHVQRRAFADETVRDACEENDLTVLDLYRYATIISNLLRNA